MSEVQKVSFRFANFFVRESHILLNEQGEFKIKVNITPKGYIFKSLNQFHLELNVDVQEETGKFNLTVKAISIFEFERGANLEEYKSSMFVVNAPAIAFPYVRAYIATLTAQSGLFTVTLPTFNLTSLADDLEKNISELE